MYLKSIEMQGFKSFADKTLIDFDQGVTAVVGPNGSGKSNITESLRWALGESSAKSLRGGKMPDVIFAGTQGRKALNFASVAVTLDNSDHFIKQASDLIRIERHIYRNGDSDYLIDGKKVRLRDIHELFMDTGLGRDSFSIISQGRVESIFNSKPEERRAIFEEAAGVLKYKTRKKETESKLNQTQDNLDRLEDIIYELDLQLKPLKQQAETAKQFLILEKERKQLDLDLLIYQIEDQKQKQAKLDSELKDAQEVLDAYYAEKAELDQDYHLLKKGRQDLVEQIKTCQEEWQDTTKIMSELDKEAALLALESSQTEEKRADALKELEVLKEDKNQLDQELTEKQATIEQVEAQLKEVEKDIQSLKQKLARFDQNPDQVLEQLRDEFVDLMQTEADQKTLLTQVETDLKSYQETQNTQSAETEKLNSEILSLTQQTQVALKSYQSAKQQVEDLLEDYQNKSQEVLRLEEVYKEKQAQMFHQMDQIKHKEARQESLKQIQKSHSQFYAGVRAVLKASHELDGIIGAVSEHLSFAPSYQTALEIALGASSQHIIVEDESAAKRSIQFLQKSRQGRATFLPLTTIKPRYLSDEVINQLSRLSGFIGLASELVTYDAALSVIFKNLLGTTAIFQTIDQANQAARELRYQVRIVTLDGSEIRPGGVFSGGSRRQQNPTFIKPELDQLKQDVTALSVDLLGLEQEVASLKQTLDGSRQGLENLKQAGDQARLLEQKEELQYQQLSERLSDLELAFSKLVPKDNHLREKGLLEQKAQLHQDLENIQKQKEELQKEMHQLKENKESLTKELSDVSQLLNERQLSERELANTLKFESANFSRLELDLEQVVSKIQELEAFLEASHQLSSENLPDLEEKIRHFKAQADRLQQDSIKLQFELEDTEAQLEEIEEKLTSLGQKNDTFIRNQAALETELKGSISQLQQLGHRLITDYQKSYDEAKQAAQFVENSSVAKQRLMDLERSIKDLGPINLEAVEQSEEVSQRLSFLSSQKSDLVQAKTMLLDTISDMDAEVKERFTTTFEAIRDNFKQTFRSMFGGGAADLILTSSDLLSAGVEISVQPPGKKIQSLNLMSGGEKALSALALLFAIIKVKTIPFVILDEVEAALDEANVKRFGDYLNRFDKSSQFIVVTHRKGTMAAADSIYGVTMQESGVSKLVSVKLKDVAT
ncbi:chromosome segregation protein SMC [Streptococcus sp. 11273D007BW]|nr:chromosome segregation protein SMC [Streptococcus sp.]